MNQQRKMKLLITVLLLLLVGIRTGHAQEIYDQFLSEGKTWTYRADIEKINALTYEMETIKMLNYLTLRGDTMIDGYLWKKAYFTDTFRDSTYLYNCYREDGRALYNTKRKLYWFTMNEGDTCTYYIFDYCYYKEYVPRILGKIDTLFANNRYYLRYSFGPIPSEGEKFENEFYWVSGIGHQDFGIKELEDEFYSSPYRAYQTMWTEGDITYCQTTSGNFSTCYENDELVFYRDQFRMRPVSGIQERTKVAPSYHAVYDMQGRRVSPAGVLKLGDVEDAGNLSIGLQNLPPGMYIRDGRKIVVK